MQTADTGNEQPIRKLRNVIREKEITTDEIQNRYGPTLDDWTPGEVKMFTSAVRASHGWNYFNAMAAMAIQ